MPIYEYKALDTGGGSKSGIVDADTPREARNKLRAEGVHVVEIHAIEERKAGAAGTVRRSFFAKKVNPAHLAIMTRQFATLLGAGISAVDALKALSQLGLLRIRLWVMLNESNDALAARMPHYWLIGYGERHLTVRGSPEPVHPEFLPNP